VRAPIAPLLATLLAALPASAELVAERITADYAARLQLHGPDADGGIDDFALRNGTLCAVIADAAHEAPISPQGGGLLDLVRCGNANDQWSALVPLVNLSRSNVVPVTELRSERDGRSARVIASGERPGLRIRTTYQLALAAPDVLSIITELSRGEGGDRMFAFGEVTFHAVAAAALRSCAATSRSPSARTRATPARRSPCCEASWRRTRTCWSAATRSRRSLRHRAERAELRRAGGRSRSRPSRSPASFTMTGVFARPFCGRRRGAPGLLSAAQLPLMDLEPGVLCSSAASASASAQTWRR
jgi:hypothetical protein